MADKYAEGGVELKSSNEGGSEGSRAATMSQIIPSDNKQPLSQELLDSLNIPQAAADNKKNLDNIGGTNGLATMLKLNLSEGLSTAQVTQYRDTYGPNRFPEKPMKSWFKLYLESFNDTTLIILIVAALVRYVARCDVFC